MIVAMLANLPLKMGPRFPGSTNRGVYGGGGGLKPRTEKLVVGYTPRMSPPQAGDRRLRGGRPRQARRTARRMAVSAEPASLPARPDAIPSWDARSLLKKLEK